MYALLILCSCKCVYNMAEPPPPKRKRTRASTADRSTSTAAANFGEIAQQLYKTGEYSDPVVKSGDLLATWNIHKAVVCVQSQWFATAVREGRFLEGSTNVIVINEDNPEAVEAMVQFLYG